MLKEEYAMKKFALVIAAAACLLTVPAVVQPANAETDVRIGVNDRHDNGWHNGWRHRGIHSRAEVVVGRPHCRTIIIRKHRGNATIVRKIRQCR
jgi:hypothetical protein